MDKKLFYNGEIYSVNSSGTAEISKALYIEGETIRAVGDFSPEDFSGTDTECIDLKGNAVLPGLSDSHLHVSSTAEMVFDLPIYYLCEAGDTRETLLQKYIDRVGAFAKEHPDMKVVRASGWDPAPFYDMEGGLPTACELDAACSDRPAILVSYDHHFLWVNSKALAISGIDADTPTPRNGTIERDETGAPTGVFSETTAIDELRRRVPGADYSVEEYEAGILEYQKTYGLPFGTMLVCDALVTDNARCAYQNLARSGQLNMRVRGCIYADPAGDPAQFDRMIEEKGIYDTGDLFRMQTIKFFMDGSILSFYLEKPFEKEFLKAHGLPEDYLGFPQWDLQEVKDAFLKLHNAGFQIHVHCMGAGAVHQALDAFEYVKENGMDLDNRHVIAHVMNILPEDLERMAELGVIAAMQPMWEIYDAFTEASYGLLGVERVLDSYPLGKLKRAGVTITCGTDFPVTIPPSPFLGIATGITRSIGQGNEQSELYGDKVLGPAEDPYVNCATLTDMVGGYTVFGAYQAFCEETTGSLKPGKSADFVLLDGTIADTDPDKIRQLAVKESWFKGRRVYCSKSAE